MEQAAPLVLSYGWASGVNAYLTVALFGILGRSGVADAPDAIERWEVIAVALAMFAIEFVIDKIPFLDSVWDLPHWAIRPAVGSALGVAIAGDAGALDGAMDDALAVGGGGVTALASHGVKAAIRLGVNSSPEPFTNAIVSLVEDLAVAGVTLIATEHPWVAFAIATVLLAAGVAAALLLAKLIRTGYRRVRARLERRRGPPPSP